jgi:hypothetical protein
MNRFKIGLAMIFASTVIFLGCNRRGSMSPDEQKFVSQQAGAEEIIAIQNLRLVSSLKSEAALFGVGWSSLDSIKVPEITDTASRQLVRVRLAIAKADQVQIAQAINQILRLKILAIGGSIKDQNLGSPFVYTATNDPGSDYLRALQALADEADIHQRLLIRWSFVEKSKGTPWPHPFNLQKAHSALKTFLKLQK